MNATPPAWLILAALLAAYLWYVRGGGVASDPGRIGRYRRWMRRAPLAFGATSLLALLIGGRLGTLFHLPSEFMIAAACARHLAGFGGDPVALELAVLGGFGGGVLLGLAIAWWRKRRGKRQFIMGNLDRLLPRTGHELRWTAMLALVAGLIEELFFRLTVPLFATLATGSAPFGFGLALALFVFAHRYQGRLGMVFSAIAGALLTILYLATGALWFAMLVHALVNLNGLVLRPALIRAG